MAEKASLKEEVKKLINSFLCGYVKGATLKELNNDYSMMEGTPIPFRKLGYTDVEDFLRSIPDAVTLNWERGECIVRAVANENNQRILSLVSKQKTNTSKRGGSRRPPRRNNYGSSRGGSGSGRYGPPRMGRMRPATSAYSRPTPPPLMRPTVPNFILTKVQELFAAYKDGLNATNFEMAFSRRFGGRINYRELGFQSLYDFLMAMPDVVQLEKFAGGLYRIYAKDRPPEQSKEMHQKEAPSHRSRMLSVSDDDDDEKEEKEETGDVRVAHKWKVLIRQVLEKHPNGIWSTKFSLEFRHRTGEDLPFKRLGFHSLIELLSALPDIVAIERPSQLDWLLFDARIKTGPASPVRIKVSKSEQNKVFTSGQDRFKETLRQVLLAHSEGVLLGELASQFQDLTGQAIPFEDLGFSTVDKLVTSEQNQDVLSIKYEGHGQVFVYGIPTTKKVPKLLIKAPEPKEPKRKVPMDAVGPGNCYKAIDVPSDIQYMVVYVSNVESPGQFWIQLRGENTTDALEDLMDELEDFYGSPSSTSSKDYALPDTLLKAGQVCAALFPEDDNWHRVTITEVRQDGFAEVYYVDYGSTACVSITSIMMLKSQFLRLPAQALKARLANLRPPEGDRWPVSARQKLLNLVADKAVVAMPTNTTQDGVLSLCLCDTSGAEDVHINDLLVTSGLAQMLYDDYTLPINSNHKPTEVLLGSPKGPLGDIHRDPNTADLKLRSIGASHSVPLDKAGSEQSENETESENEQTEDEYVRNIKFVELTDRYSMHMIKYNDELYCSSAEVSAFIWEKDLLRSMLHQKKAKFDKLTLRSQEQPDIFEELKEYKVKGTLEGTNQLKSHITIFSLHVVIEILKLFDHRSAELIYAIQKEIDTFDPNVPYWKGADSEIESDQENNNDDLDLDRADLETACNHLQLQRKKILNQLRSDPEHVTTYVDELDKVERQLVEVRCSLNQLAKTKENKSVLTEEEKFVQMCVEEQYKDCQPPASTKPKDKPSRQVQPVVKEQAQQPSSPAKKTNLVAPMPATTKSSEETTSCTDKVNSLFSSMLVGGDITSQPQATNQPVFTNTAFTQPRMGAEAYGFPSTGQGMGGHYPQMNPVMAGSQLPPDQQQMLLQYQLAMAQMVMTQQNMGVMSMNPNPRLQQSYGQPQVQQIPVNTVHTNPAINQNQMMGGQPYGPFSTMHPLGNSQGQVFGQHYRPPFGAVPPEQYTMPGTVPQMAEGQMGGMQYGPQRGMPRSTAEGHLGQQQFGPLSKQDK